MKKVDLFMCLAGLAVIMLWVGVDDDEQWTDVEAKVQKLWAAGTNKLQMFTILSHLPNGTNGTNTEGGPLATSPPVPPPRGGWGAGHFGLLGVPLVSMVPALVCLRTRATSPGGWGAGHLVPASPGGWGAGPYISAEVARGGGTNNDV